MIKTSRLGFTAQGWEDSFQIEAVLTSASICTKLLQAIYKRTADQKYLPIVRLWQAQTAPKVAVLGAPVRTGPKLLRSRCEVTASRLCVGAQKIRTILGPALQSRHLSKCPCDSILIVIALSKQLINPLSMLPEDAWRARATAKLNAAFAFYERQYKRLTGANATDTVASPARKKSKPDSMISMLLDDKDGTSITEAEANGESELERWLQMPRATVQKYTGEDGFVDHYALASGLKADIPVMHFMVQAVYPAALVQTNTESFFSLTGNLQDEKKSMSSKWMQTLSFIQGQTKKPSNEEVKTKYLEMFRGRRARAGIIGGINSDSDSGDSDDADSDSESDSSVHFNDADDWEVATPLDATEPRLEVEVEGAAANEMAVEGA